MAEPNFPLLRRLTLLGATAETTSGTWANSTQALSGTNVYDAVFTAGDWFAQGQRNPLGNYVGSISSVPGIISGSANFNVQVTPSDQTLPLLQMCGYINATGYKFKTDFASRKTYSLKKWNQGTQKPSTSSSYIEALAGCAGDCTFTAKIGAPLVAEFSAMGRWITDSTVNDSGAAMPTQAPVTAFPYVCTAMTLNLASTTAPIWDTVTISLGNSLEVREDFTSSSGVLHAYVASRQPRITIDTEARLRSDLDTYALMLAGTEVAFSAVFTGGGKTLTISCPKAQRVAVSPSVRGEINVHQITLQPNISSGDDDLVFAEA